MDDEFYLFYIEFPKEPHTYKASAPSRLLTPHILGVSMSSVMNPAVTHSSVARGQVEDTLYESHRHLRVRGLGREVDVLWDMQTEDLVYAKRDGKFPREMRCGQEH